ncbi:MAG: 16S rRNA (cytidine(1402)-2'-O)-methyltransferase [Gammaproteobacteria bacterium]|nr:MAG: 16S rRNA (cytidine(1402)-2'-O)-methyltransferase [Gammaproteobacteria bacterium]
MSNNPGILYVVATPIGNLGDISARAIEVLRDADYIAAEDTRRSRVLMQSIGANRPMLSLHEHNEMKASKRVLELLKAGHTVALVSDAGTPLISDPGHRLIMQVHALGIQVSPIPGPNAVASALAVAGLPCDHYVFEGFLPPRRTARRSRLSGLANETRTIVLFEACHRIKAMLADMADLLGPQRRAVMCRELTKLHETIVAKTLGDLVELVETDPYQTKGEFVLVVAGAESDAPKPTSLDPSHVFELLLGELPRGKAASLAAKITGVPRRQFYSGNQ